MTLDNERKLWKAVGFTGLLLGLAAMSGAIWMLFNGDDVIDKTPSRVEGLGAAVGVCGVAALVLARILGVMSDREQQASLVWSIISFGSIIIGIGGGIVQGMFWMNDVRTGFQVEGFTPWQKAVIIAAGFLVMTGVISLIGERSAHLYIRRKHRLRAGAGVAGR